MKLRFSAPDYYYPDDIDKLPRAHRGQLAAAGESGLGAKTLEEALRPADYRWEHYTVTHTDSSGQDYDVWVVDVDTAYVFFAGSEQQAGIKMIQNDFDPTDAAGEDDPDLVALAAAMQRAFRQRRNEG